MAIALEEYPNMEIDPYLRRLDTCAARCEVLLNDGSGHFTLVVETEADAPVDALFELELAGSVALVP